MIDNITINSNDDDKLRAIYDIGETAASKQMELRLGKQPLIACQYSNIGITMVGCLVALRPLSSSIAIIDVNGLNGLS